MNIFILFMAQLTAGFIIGLMQGVIAGMLLKGTPHKYVWTFILGVLTALGLATMYAIV